MAIVFAVTTIICAIGWLVRYVSSAALIMYLVAKDLPLPTDEEIRMCTREVVCKLFKVDQT